MSREKGDILEDFVQDSWPERLRKEPNSGAANDQNDLYGDYSSIECKRKLTVESMGLTKKELKRCIERARRRGIKPVWVCENSWETFVTMRYCDFVDLFMEVMLGEEEKEEGV